MISENSKKFEPMQKKQLYYQFDLDIQRVYLLINMRCQVQLWWKSGKDKITTMNNMRLHGTQKYFDVNQRLGVTAKITEENGRLREKKTELLIILFTGDNKSKLGGRVYLNLNQFVYDGREEPSKFGEKKIDCKLVNCPDENSRIVFKLSWKFLKTQDNMLGSQGGQSLHDISFQANNFSSNMTFRPREQNYQERGRRKNTQSKEKNIDKRQFASNNYDSRRLTQKQQFKQSFRGDKQEKPMEFSFNPSQSEREKLGIDNSQLVKDLKMLLEDKSQEIRLLKENIEQLKTRDQMRQAEKDRISSSRSLSLMNQLNSTAAEKQELQKQLTETNKRYSQLKEESRSLQSQLSNYKANNQKLLKQLHSENEQQKKYHQEQLNELSYKLEESEKKYKKLQDEVFRKQNELLSKETQIQKFKKIQEMTSKQSTEQLKTISFALQEVKQEYQKTYEEKQIEKKKCESLQYRLSASQNECQQMGKKLQQLEQNLLKQRDISKRNYSLLEERFEQRENVIREIQEEFRKLNQEKSTGSRAKDEEINHLREKFNASCRKIDELAQREQSYKNQISSLNVRIKSLEDICAQNQKSEKIIEEKEELLEKAKEYIRLKEEEIEERDEFIKRAKVYVDGKEKELESLKSIQSANQSSKQESQNQLMRIKQYEDQIKLLKSSIQQKQRQIFTQMQQKERLLRQIEEMENYIDALKQKIMDYQDTIDQMHRKIDHQEQTLKDLVKKNLDMQIQLNVKNFQLQALKGNQ